MILHTRVAEPVFTLSAGAIAAIVLGALCLGLIITMWCMFRSGRGGGVGRSRF